MSASGFPEPGTFSFAPAQILDSNIFCNCRHFLHMFRVPLSALQADVVKNDVVSPKSISFIILSTLGQCFVSFLPVLCRLHTQTRIVLLLG